MKRLKYMFIVLAAAGVSLAASLPVMAAEPYEVALPFSRTIYDASTLAMGGSGLLNTANAAAAPFQNAALMSYSDKTFDLGLTYQMFQPAYAKSNVLSAGIAGKLFDKLGIGGGVTMRMNPGYELVDGDGIIGDTYHPKDIQANLGLSYKIIPALSVGVNFKYLNSNIAPEASYGAFASDIFLMTRIKGFKAALGVSNIGTKVKSGDNKFSIPSSATLALGYSALFASKHGLDVEIDADWWFQNTISASAGLTYLYNEMVYVRAGYRYGGNSVLPSFASAGIGVKFFGVKLDLAYLFASESLSNTLAVTLGFQF